MAQKHQKIFKASLNSQNISILCFQNSISCLAKEPNYYYHIFSKKCAIDQFLKPKTIFFEVAILTKCQMLNKFKNLEWVMGNLKDILHVAKFGWKLIVPPDAKFCSSSSFWKSSSKECECWADIGKIRRRQMLLET